jgi:hypothetical protein
MKKFKFTLWDALVFGVFVALTWGKSAQTILLAVVAFLLFLLVRSILSKSTADSTIVSDGNEFLVDEDELSLVRINLDSDIYFPEKSFQT